MHPKRQPRTLDRIASSPESCSATETQTAHGRVIYGDNLDFLCTLPDESVDLIYVDPPFNTGKPQVRRQLQTVRETTAPDRIGFKGLGYRTHLVGVKSFDDTFQDYAAFLVPRLREAHRVLSPTGSMFLHLDYREVHYCKVHMDGIFGRESFINEIIWAYDYGARSKRRWSAKHDNILWYAKDPENYTFNYDTIDRIPYLAPSLVGPEKAARGKTPTDTWWHTIVSPTGKEKTGYPTQKPLGIIERIVRLHSRPGDLVLDFFAGSGTIGEACARLHRNYILVDNNPVALEVMSQRLGKYQPEVESMASNPPNPGTPTPASNPPNPGTPAPASNRPNPGTPAPVQLNSHVHVIAAAVWDYEDADLRNLRGPPKDLEMIEKIFSAQASDLGVYPTAQIEILKNPTVEALRSTFVRYTMDRTAKGDILVFYFSGHGAVLGNNEFGFCLKDTKIRPEGGGYLPLSLLAFDDIVRTLTAADVHPVFIIDACFSGKAGQNEQPKVVDAMQDDMHRAAASSYGLLCACYAEGLALDMTDGGAFTKAFYSVASKGLDDAQHRQKQFLELSDVSKPIQALLTKDGYPLSKLYLGPDLPEFPLMRNVAYQARRESLASYHRDTLKLLWNGGRPRTVSLAEIRDDVGVGAYGNHSKLSLAPWVLVEDAGDARHRRLTKRGILFMAGKITVPETIERDPVTQEWKPSADSKQVSLDEIGQPKKASKRR